MMRAQKLCPASARRVLQVAWTSSKRRVTLSDRWWMMALGSALAATGNLFRWRCEVGRARARELLHVIDDKA